MKISFIEGQFELAAREILADEPFHEWYKTRYGLSLLKRGCKGSVRVMCEGLSVDKPLFDLYRNYKLRRTIRRVYENSRFYHRMFDNAGISPENIQSFRDLQKLPYTFPDDLRGDSYEFLCMSERHVERPISFYSSGTTGIRKRMFFSFNDTQRIKDFIGTAMNSISDTEDTRILSLMTNSQGRGASSVYVQSVRDRGMEAWTGNMEDGAKEILRTSADHNCNVWFGDIGTIYRTAKELESEGIDLAGLGIKLIYVTMGNISDPVRGYLSEAFGCEVITHYGLTETGWGFAIEQPGEGGYYSNELDVYTEVVDPDTGEVLPDGEEGELTFTIIGREAMPLLRYRSGDIACIHRSAGNDKLDTIGFIKRRLEGVLTAADGSLITPAMIEDVIYSYSEVIDYRLYADSAAKISVEIEVTERTDEIEKSITSALAAIPGAAAAGLPDIRIVPSGELKQYCYEKKRFIRI